MPTTPKSIQGVVAVSEDSGITPLGYLTWFSVPDESVSLRTLKKVLALNGLPTTLAPKDTKAKHVFKRAMREEEGIKKVDGLVIETAVAQVQENREYIIYQISRLKRDLKDNVVDYPKAMRVIFNKETEDIDYNILGEVPASEVVEMQESIEDFYNRNAAKVTGARVRGIVRNYIKDEPDETRGVEGLSGENLRGRAGGIYFVPAINSGQVEALSAMLHELYKGRAYLHAVPLADGASERELIQRHHVANVRQDMVEAIAEVKGILERGRERTPRKDSVAHHWARYQATLRRVSKYRDLLEDEAQEIQDMGAILKRQLDKLPDVE